jgi:AcrR family transcriptional regulator
MPEKHGERRRREILGAAVDLSSAQGLSGLSIGQLARETGMSKSGLFAHFGSKEELQLAVVALAAEGYEREVIEPAERADAGLPRLRALFSNWAAYIESTEYRGGCFFDAASSEFASRPGAVRDRLARLCGRWLERLEEQARLAVRLGELDCDPGLLAFQLHAYVEEANWSRQLLGHAHGFDRARAAAESTLAAAAAATPTTEPRRLP